MTSFLGLGLLFLSLICLGTWPALLRLGSFGGERNLCHVYVDYSTAYFLVSSLPYLWTRPSASPLTTPMIGVAMLGGSLLSAGNLSMQWATTVYRAPLTTVLALQASLTVFLGTSLNYCIEPHKTPHPQYLVVGVVVFWVAIFLATRAQLLHGRQQSRSDRSVGVEMETQYGSHHQQQDQDDSNTNNNSKVESWNTNTPYDPVSMSEHAFDPKDQHTTQGVLVAAAGGLCFGFFSPAFNIAVNDPFGNAATASPSRVVEANMWFSLAFWLASILGNTILLRAGDDSIFTIWKEYVQQSGLYQRRLALISGVVCAAGNILQFQGGQLVGYATADLVQAYPIVSIWWDMHLFGEFRQASHRLIGLLVGMYVAYLSGIVLLAKSSME